MTDADRFFTAFASGADPIAAAHSVADALVSDGAKGALGIVYLGDRWADEIEPILRILILKTGVQDWIGTLGAGVFAGRDVAFDRPGIAAMVTSWPAGSFRLFDSIPDEGWKPAPDGRLSTAIVHADHRNRGLETVLRQLSADSGSYLLGGVTMSRVDRYDQIAGGLTDGGVSGALLSPEIAVTTGVSHGFKAVGPMRVITDASDTIIRELDGNSPFNVMLSDFSLSEISSLAQVGSALYVGLPLSASDDRQFLVRAVVGVDGMHGALMIDQQIEAGQRLLFCQRSRETASADLVETARSVKARAIATHGRARGALYVACIERGPMLFSSVVEEIQLLQDGLGDLPLIGFYSRGEIARDALYKYAGVLAVF